MNGIRYHRVKQGLTRTRLAELTGISIATLKNMELASEQRGFTSLNYVRLKDALGVTIDELVRNDLPEIENGSYVYSYQSKTENPNNIITTYRRQHSLSFRALIKRLGLTSAQSGLIACARDTPCEKHIARLAAFEGLTPEEFTQRYQAEINKNQGI